MSEMDSNTAASGIARDELRRAKALRRAAEGVSTPRLETLAAIPGMLRALLDYAGELVGGIPGAERPLVLHGAPTARATWLLSVYGEPIILAVVPDGREAERKAALVRLADLVRSATEEPALPERHRWNCGCGSVCRVGSPCWKCGAVEAQAVGHV